MKENKLLPNNDFPKVGLLSLESSGEKLLKFYLESIFDLKTCSNIRGSSVADNTNDCWIIHSDFPLRDKNHYFKSQLSFTINTTLFSNYYQSEISLGILLIRNPVEQIMAKLVLDYQNSNKQQELEIELIDGMIDDWKTFIHYWLESPIPIHLVRYEDLIADPFKTLKSIILFILGTETVEGTVIEGKIIETLKKSINNSILVDNVDVSSSKALFSNKNLVLKIQQKFDEQLFEILQQFNYEESNSRWITDFNLLSLKEAICFHSTFEGNYVNSSFKVLSIYSV